LVGPFTPIGSSRPVQPTIGPAVPSRSRHHTCRIVISRLQTPVHSGAPGLRAEVVPRTSHPAVTGRLETTFPCV